VRIAGHHQVPEGAAAGDAPGEPHRGDHEEQRVEPEHHHEGDDEGEHQRRDREGKPVPTHSRNTTGGRHVPAGRRLTSRPLRTRRPHRPAPRQVSKQRVEVVDVRRL